MSPSTLEENWGALGNRERWLQIFGFNISEERALWKDLGHQARDFPFGKQGGGSASAPI